YVKNTPSADKTALKADLKAGKNIPGCHLVHRNNLQIK
ncbi:siphovirus Gp157 family protein, partial [Candidatus Pacearchaeota archaeon]|nr:siphovirus Gp157 family protein [Candidatus Pacearchaeota archaeon]